MSKLTKTAAKSSENISENQIPNSIFVLPVLGKKRAKKRANWQNIQKKGEGMKIGYARVSTLEQNLDRQLDQLKAEGCERIFCDKISGSSKSRPELDRMIDMLRSGDVVVVTELSRLSRSTKDLLDKVELFRRMEVNLRSLKEPWADTLSPTGKFLFTISAGIAEFDLDLIRMRTREGVAAARARGRFGGRPRKSEEDLRMAKTLYEAKYSLDEIKKRTGVSKSTLYAYLKK